MMQHQQKASNQVLHKRLGGPEGHDFLEGGKN